MADSDEAKPAKVSRAPAPITPLPDRPVVLPEAGPIPPPKWGKWRHMQDVELWEAVALSVNLEPAELPVYLGAYDAFGDNPFRICPSEFQERLQMANSNCGTSFPCKPAHPLRARSLVNLPTFGSWAASVWDDLPQDLLNIVPMVNPGPVAPPPRPVPRRRAQEEAILATLAELNINPQAIPRPSPGKQSKEKNAVRNALRYSRDVMNKAWQRLRDDGRIKDA